MALEIKLHNLSVGYLSETIINNLSLNIGCGEFVGIFGPNGAGKTTLLCAVNGLAGSIKGKVFVGSREMNIKNGNALRRRIGYVPQNFEIDPRLPVLAREVAMMGVYGKTGLFRFPGKREKALLAELTELLGIGSIAGKPFGCLSGGEKKRVLIARALMQEPEIMLFDEIFAWLDREAVKKFTEIISCLHEKKDMTTLLVSHDMHIIKTLCYRIVWMEKGRIVFDGSRDKFIKRIKTEDGLD